MDEKFLIVYKSGIKNKRKNKENEKFYENQTFDKIDYGF